MKPACEIYLCSLAEFAWTRIWLPGSEEFMEKPGRASLEASLEEESLLHSSNFMKVCGTTTPLPNT